MKDFILQASIGQSTTTLPIKARDIFSAKVLAVQKINSNASSDKRWAEGLVVLKDFDKKVVWKIKEEGEDKNV